MMDKFAMGAYGVYVWSSFALALLVFAWNEWSAHRRRRIVWQDVEVRIKALEDHG